MTGRRALMTGAAAMALLLGGGRRSAWAAGYAVTHSDAEWRRMLTPDQYIVLRQEGTETPYTSPLLHENRQGVFCCAGCGQILFSSRTKYDSGTGWPSFWTAVEDSYQTKQDHSMNMLRTEIHCARCGSHLGHIFEDGPPPTGLRYCMDGLALTFMPT